MESDSRRMFDGTGEGRGMRAVDRVTCVGCSYRFMDVDGVGTCFRRLAILTAMRAGEDEYKVFIGTGRCWVPEGCVVILDEVVA